jgi:hypothetical protein
MEKLQAEARRAEDARRVRPRHDVLLQIEADAGYRERGEPGGVNEEFSSGGPASPEHSRNASREVGIPVMVQ